MTNVRYDESGQMYKIYAGSAIPLRWGLVTEHKPKEVSMTEDYEECENVGEEVDLKVREYCVVTGLDDYEEAFYTVLDRNPDLKERYALPSSSNPEQEERKAVRDQVHGAILVYSKNYDLPYDQAMVKLFADRPDVKTLYANS